MADDNSHIRDLDPCLPDEYLKALAEGRVLQPTLRSAIEAHVGLCAQCGAKVRSYTRPKLSPDDLIAKQLASLRQEQAILKRHLAQGPRPGTIWRTVPDKKEDLFGPLVLVLGSAEASQENLLTVAEVSEHIPQAIENDMILDPKESGLRFRCMVRAGNIFVMNPSSLQRFAGELPDPLTKTVLEFCQQGERFDERVPLSQFIFLRDPEGHQFVRRKGVTSGILVTGNDDPRLAAAASSRHLFEYLHVVQPSAKKSASKPLDKQYLLGLLKGLVSELSMWGSLLIPPPPPKPAYAGGGLESLSRSSSLSMSPDRQKPEPVKVEVKPAGPTREEVLKHRPEQRQFKHGDQIKLSVTVPEDGHLVIVHYCEQTGDVEIAFPAPEDKFSRVTSKQTIQIERKLVSPPGRYGFKVIFSRNNLLPWTQAKEHKGKRILHDLMALVERIERLEEEAWREATFEYEIVKNKGFFSRLFS